MSERAAVKFGNWNAAPFAGEVWRRRKDGKTETRRVVDRTFGGNVCFWSGPRRDWGVAPCQQTYPEWMAWQKDAKLITPRARE